MKFTDCIDIVGERPKKFDGYRKYVSTGALNTDHIDENAVELVDYETRPSRADLIAEPGDVLFAKMAATKKTLLLDTTTSKYIYSTGFFAIRAKKSIIEPECLQLLVNSDLFLTQKDKNASGATQRAITNKGLEAIEIALPPIQAQETIVKKLLSISAIVSARKQQLSALDTLIKARFVEMFGDPKNNPNNYPECQLSDYIEFLTSGSRGWAEYCTCDGSEWFITIKNVKDCRISIENMQRLCAPDNAEAKRTKVQEGDLLISITADLGRTGVVTKEIAEHGAYINQHLTCIRLNKNVLNPLFVAFFMDSSAGKEQFALKNQSAVKAGLNFNSINSLRLFIPPMDKQKEFVEFSSQVDKSKFVVQQALDKAQLLFDSLMQQYFG